MNDDDIDNIHGTAIECVEDEDCNNKYVEDGPKTGAEEKVDNEGAIDDKAK